MVCSLTHLPAGTPLIRFGGTPVCTAELHRLFDEAQLTGSYVDTISIGGDRHLVLPAGSIAHHGNHSCDPTMWLGAPLELVARVDLVPGAELTSDYGVTSDDAAFEMACQCGSARCRLVITGCDWQLERACSTCTKVAGPLACRRASTTPARPDRTAGSTPAECPRTPATGQWRGDRSVRRWRSEGSG